MRRQERCIAPGVSLTGGGMPGFRNLRRIMVEFSTQQHGVKIEPAASLTEHGWHGSDGYARIFIDIFSYLLTPYLCNLLLVVARNILNEYLDGVTKRISKEKAIEELDNILNSSINI